MKANLKLSDLKERSEIIPMKLLSVRVPIDLIDRIDRVVELLNAGKGEVVVALLNEGLERHDDVLKKSPRSEAPRSLAASRRRR
jgi:hypothetical protein